MQASPAWRHSRLILSVKTQKNEAALEKWNYFVALVMKLPRSPLS